MAAGPKVRGRGIRAIVRRAQRLRDTAHSAAFHARVTVEQIQKEAKAAGATLAHGGKGGLDPALALKVFRRDKWKCSNEDCPEPKRDLDLDHISGHAKEIKEDPDARDDEDLKEGVELGHVDDPDALHVLCKSCHDRAHDRERSIEDGKKPKPMRGDRR